MPVEEIDETRFEMIVYISCLPYAGKFENDFHYREELLPAQGF